MSTTNNELSDMPSAAQPGVTQPIAAKGITKPLYRVAQLRFSIITRRVFFAMANALIKLLRLLDNKIASAVVLAKSVALPLAMLISAPA